MAVDFQRLLNRTARRSFAVPMRLVLKPLVGFSLLVVAVLATGFWLGLHLWQNATLPKDTNNIQSLTAEQGRRLVQGFRGVAVTIQERPEGFSLANAASQRAEAPAARLDRAVGSGATQRRCPARRVRQGARLGDDPGKDLYS